MRLIFFSIVIMLSYNAQCMAEDSDEHEGAGNNSHSAFWGAAYTFPSYTDSSDSKYIELHIGRYEIHLKDGIQPFLHSRLAFKMDDTNFPNINIGILGGIKYLGFSNLINGFKSGVDVSAGVITGIEDKDNGGKIGVITSIGVGFTYKSVMLRFGVDAYSGFYYSSLASVGVFYFFE